MESVKEAPVHADEMRTVATTVSQPVRIAAVLGLAAALALGGAFMLLGRKGANVTAPIVPTHRVHHAAKTHQAAAATKLPNAHATKTLRTGPKVPGRRAAELAALRAGLPARLAWALGQSPVVVVEITDPQSEVDGIALAEAQAGAQRAGAAFVPLSVLSQADIGALTEQIGQVLPDPGLLVYTRPARLATRLDGFVDRDTVAQAAVNAAHGL